MIERLGYISAFFQGIRFGKLDTGLYVKLGNEWLWVADEWLPYLENWGSKNRKVLMAWEKYRLAMQKPT